MEKVQKQENREITQKTKSFWSQMPHLTKYSLRQTNTVLGRLKKKKKKDETTGKTDKDLQWR